MTLADQSDPKTALVVGATRRVVTLLSDKAELCQGTLSSNAIGATVGDRVLCKRTKDQLLVTEIVAPKNRLQRMYGKKVKRIASNLDRLYIVTALLPLFNTTFVDRALAVAYQQDIPCSLIVNKIDLGIQDTVPFIEIYKKIGIELIYTSAKVGPDIGALIKALSQSALEIVALVGISGVGKSTLLNKLVPEAERKTADISHKIGQGTQATSQAFGYLYQRSNIQDLLIIDLPGFHNFGVTHLTKEVVAASFPEIVKSQQSCKFSNCSHIAEAACAVKKAVADGLIASSRYESYCAMIAEIEAAKEY